MFSSRLDWDARPNRLSELLRQRREAGASILDLTVSNPTLAGIEYPDAEILAAVSDPRSLRYEPEPLGAMEAREAIAGYYAERGYEVAPGRIVLTASTSEAYARLFQLLCDPGDEVLVPRPSYPLFEFLAGLESVAVRTYPLRRHDGGWLVDLDEVRRAVTSRTRAIVVVNPNNPTGSFLKVGERDALVELCAARRLAMISDEVFADYALDRSGAPERVTTLIDVPSVLSFCLSGLSKVIALPQLKLGWIVVGGPDSLRLPALERLELIADTYLSVATPVQLGATRLLGLRDALQAQVLSRLRRNLAALRETFALVPSLRVLPVEGGWYVVTQVPRTRSEEEWALTLLAERDVLVQPGYFYDFEEEAYLVASLLTPPETFAEGIRRLLELE
jgi:aspartate/methionine/tyrosine aminotransferase